MTHLRRLRRAFCKEAIRVLRMHNFIQRLAAKPAIVPVQSDEDKHMYACLSVCLFVCRMYVCIYVCMYTVVSVYTGVFRPTFSSTYHRVTRALPLVAVVAAAAIATAVTCCCCC